MHLLDLLLQKQGVASQLNSGEVNDQIFLARGHVLQSCPVSTRPTLLLLVVKWVASTSQSPDVRGVKQLHSHRRVLFPHHL